VYHCIVVFCFIENTTFYLFQVFNFYKIKEDTQRVKSKKIVKEINNERINLQNMQNMQKEPEK